MNTARVEDTRIRRLGLVAAAGPIVFVIGWAVGAATQDGFRIIRDDESALAAIGADHPWITMTGDAVLGIGILTLSIAQAALLDGVELLAEIGPAIDQLVDVLCIRVPGETALLIRLQVQRVTSEQVAANARLFVQHALVKGYDLAACLGVIAQLRMHDL